jgi:hypothetical protein
MSTPETINQQKITKMASEEFKAYLEKHRTKYVNLIDSQEKELARLYIETAGEIKARAELIINKDGLTYAQAKIRINSLLREASRLTNNFEGILNKSLVEASNLGMEINKISMSMYQESLKKEGVNVNFTRILSKVNPEAVKYTFNKIWNDGLKLSDRIWLIDKRSKQEIERIIMQNVLSGGSASDKVTIKALENLFNPEYTPAKLTSLHGRRVGYEASRLLRTEMSVAFNEADRLSSEKNPGSTGEKWLIAIGACEACTALNGLSVKETGYPPLHSNCRCCLLNDVQSIEAFTNRWISFMDNPASDKKLGNWILEVYKKAA